MEVTQQDLEELFLRVTVAEVAGAVSGGEVSDLTNLFGAEAGV